MARRGKGEPSFTELLRELDDAALDERWSEVHRSSAQLLHQAPHSAYLWRAHYVSLCHLDLGPEQEEETLQRWYSSCPNDPTPFAWLVDLYHQNGLKKAAAEMLRRFLQGWSHDEANALMRFYAPVLKQLQKRRPTRGLTRRAPAPKQPRSTKSQRKAAAPKQPRSTKSQRKAAAPKQPEATRNQGKAPERPARAAAQRKEEARSTQEASRRAEDPQEATALLQRRPPPEASSTPVIFETQGLFAEALGRLLAGERAPYAALSLARQGGELLCEDGYGKLLCLQELVGVKRFTHQRETVLAVLKRFRGRVLLADEVGLGKTIEASLVLKEYLLRKQVRRALILVPPALVRQWQGELEEKFGVASLSTLDSAWRDDPVGFWERGPVLVASLALARMAPHRERVLSQRFDLVIIDEAHHVKNRSTKSWELVNGLRSKFLLMLTATPVETNLAELYNLVTLLRPGTLGTLRDFRRRFVDPRDGARPKDPEQLKALLRDVMIRNTRATCGVDLPPRSARTLVVRSSPEETRLFEALELAARQSGELGPGASRLLRLLMEEAGSSPQALMATLRRTLQSPARHSEKLVRALKLLLRLAELLKRSSKLERLPAVLRGGRTLLFTRFSASRDAIASELKRLQIPFASFHGGLSAKARRDAVEAFAAEGGPQVLLCSEIGGEGQNLQFCHRLVNFDLPWNPMVIEQRIGRIHRIGQTQTVEIINLATAGSVEERILDVLDARVNLFELVVGEMDLVLGELTDERDFGDRVFDIYTRATRAADLDQGFDDLAQVLLGARGRLERTKALDELLFNEGYEA